MSSLTLLISLFSSKLLFLEKSHFSCKTFCHIDAGGSKLTSRRTVSPEIFHIRENIVAFIRSIFPANTPFPFKFLHADGFQNNGMTRIFWFQMTSSAKQWGKNFANCSCISLTFYVTIHAQSSMCLWCQMRRGLIASWLMVESEILLWGPKQRAVRV